MVNQKDTVLKTELQLAFCHEREAAGRKERASRDKHCRGWDWRDWEDGNLIISSLALWDFLNDMQKF